MARGGAILDGGPCGIPSGVLLLGAKEVAARPEKERRTMVAGLL